MMSLAEHDGPHEWTDNVPVDDIILCVAIAIVEHHLFGHDNVFTSGVDR